MGRLNHLDLFYKEENKDLNKDGEKEKVKVED